MTLRKERYEYLDILEVTCQLSTIMGENNLIGQEKTVCWRVVPAQCRAARSLICWSQENLAEAAGVSRSTIKDFEAGKHDLQRSTERQIVKALRDAGITFIWQEDGTVGATTRVSPVSCGFS